MEHNKPKWRGLAITILKFGVVIGAFAFLILTDRLNREDLKQAFSNPAFIAIGITLTLFPMLVSFLRYHYLLKGLGIDLGLKEINRLGFIGCFFNIFMPGSMGGDVVKVAYIIRDTGKRAPVIASAMMDRVLGMLGMLVLGGGVMLWALQEIYATPSPYLHKMVLTVLSILCVCLYGGVTSMVSLLWNRRWGFLAWAGLLLATLGSAWLLLSGQEFRPVQQPGEAIPAEVLMRSRLALTLAGSLLAGLLCVMIVPSCQSGRSLARFVTHRIPLGRHLMSFLNSLLAYRHQPGILFVSMFLSLVTHGTNLLALFFFAKAAHLAHEPTVQDIFFAAPLAFIANSLPMPGGGLGIGEGAFDALLGLCRTPEGQALTGGAAIFLIWRFWYVLLGLIGLPFYLKGKKKIQEAEEDYILHENDEEDGSASAQPAPSKTDC